MAAPSSTLAALALLLATCLLGSATATGKTSSTALTLAGGEISSTTLTLAGGRSLKNTWHYVTPTTTPTPTRTFTQTPTPTGPSASALAIIPLGDWRGQLLSLVNDVRRAHGAGPLCYNSKLNSACQAQSDSGNYGHTWTFVFATSYRSNYMGQNIAMGFPSCVTVFYAWFNELPPNDGHRLNILNPRFNQMGAGWSSNRNMWTQNFALSSEPCS